MLHNEKELLQLAADGNRAAYGELYTHYYPSLFSSLTFIAKSPEDAQEIIQDVFVKAWISRETLILVRNFGDYIFTIARHLLFDRMRQSNSRWNAEQEYNRRRPAGAALPEDDLLYKQYHRAAYDALQQLTAQKRQIFLLRTQEGLTLDEIAAQVGLSRSAVKKHLYAALEHLKKALMTQGDWLLALLILWHAAQ